MPKKMGFTKPNILFLKVTAFKRLERVCLSISEFVFAIFVIGASESRPKSITD